MDEDGYVCLAASLAILLATEKVRTCCENGAAEHFGLAYEA